MSRSTICHSRVSSVTQPVNMFFTHTVTATALQKLETVERPTDVQPSNVDAELVYWTEPEGGKTLVLDFTTGDDMAETYNKQNKYNSAHRVTVHDVRGSMDEFSLDVHGWKYVKHPVPAVKNWSDEAHVKEVLIPESEKLVLQM
jgi:hypothetical protein